jgi:hypothetical protein
MDKRQQLYFRREREKLIRDQRLLKIGGWNQGYVLPNKKIIVSASLPHNELLAYIGEDDDTIDERGGGRLVLYPDIISGDRTSVLTVEMNSEYYEKIRNIILNYIPFYKYVSKVIFEVIGFRGGVKRYSEMLLSGKEKGFSLLNPRR